VAIPTQQIEPLAVRVGDACMMLGCGATRLYELINDGKIESFLDGATRKIVVASMRRYIEEQVTRSHGDSGARPLNRHEKRRVVEGGVR
jgi:hypothetical protein